MNLCHAEDLQRDYDVAAMERRAHAVLDNAYALDVRHFDTARSYGRAEEFLGSWLRLREPDAVSVSSKWGYTYTADWRVEAEVHEVKDHSLETLERQWVETRANLGKDLDLLQIHSATLETGVLEDRRVIARLAGIRSEGVRIGLSVTGPSQGETLLRALDVSFDGAPLFDAVQATYNLLEPSVGPALRRARSSGWQVIIKEALANGRLSDRNGLSGDQAALRTLQGEAARLGTTADALALAFVLAAPFVDVALSGAATEGQLQSNLKARSVFLDERAASALESLNQNPAAYWSTRAALPWH